MDNLITEGINNRKLNKITCPHCQSEKIVKYGFYKGEQRYRCKDCIRTFNPYTGTIIHYSHYKDKWEAFIETMSQDMTLRQAGRAIGVNYSTLFYWRHKVMTLLSQGREEKLRGVIEMMKLDIPFLNKYHPKKQDEECEEDEDFKEFAELLGCRKTVYEKISLAFLYQRDNILKSYVYSSRPRDFIHNIKNDIDKKSVICLNVNYPFRYPLLYHKFKVKGIADGEGKKKFSYNAEKVRKLLTGFRSWIKVFRGVSSKYLNKYAAYYKFHKVFNTMEYVILSYLNKDIEISNHLSTIGDDLF